MTHILQLLMRTSSRWYFSVVFAVMAAVLFSDLISGGIAFNLIFVAFVLLCVVRLVTLMFKLIEETRGSAWPGPTGWMRHVFRFGGLLAILGCFLVMLVLANPALQATPVKGAAIWLTMAGVAVVAIVVVPLVLGSIAIALVLLPIAGIQALHRKHARRYRYPSRIG